jgi:hypothetical protein
MDYFVSNSKQFIEKLGTVLADRRFWVAAISLAVVFLGMPETKVQSYAEAIIAILSSLALILGWTWRPPTGLNYKEPTVKNMSMEDLANEVNRRYAK